MQEQQQNANVGANSNSDLNNQASQNSSNQPSFKVFVKPKSHQQKAIELFQQFTETVNQFRQKKQDDRGPLDKKTESIILTDIKKFSVGSMKYDIDSDNPTKLVKHYVPMFPNIYMPQGFSEKSIQNVTFKFKTNEKKSRALEGDKIYYNNIQVQFKNFTADFQSDLYSIDIMFDNVAKFACYEIDQETTRIYLVMRRPVKVFKRMTTKDKRKPFAYQQIKSPFSFDSKDKGMFMNYWNLKQVIMLEGVLDLSKDYKNLFEDLLNLDMIPKLEFVYNEDGQKDMEYELRQASIQEVEKEELEKIHDELFNRNETFNELLNQFIIPVRLSILTLLSQKKASVFTNELIKFMQELMITTKLRDSTDQLLSTRQGKDPQEIDFYLQEGNEMAQFEVRRVIYMLDKLSKDVNVRGKPKIPGSRKKRSKTLIETYRYIDRNSGDISQEIQLERQNDNDLRQRRVYQTPTLTLFYPNEREQTNRVVRQFHKYKDYFFRLVLVSDTHDKIMFGSLKEKEMLQHMKDLMKQELNIGDSQGIVLNYSNSQLKNHSVWMICKTNIPELQPDAIISSLGQFAEEGGRLKMFARRGQCFSTTKYIRNLDPQNISIIEDIEKPKDNDLDIKDPSLREGNYCFTDGCGNISEQLADEIAQKHQLAKCSAFQVRIGGVKGVLMLKPELEGIKVELRKSQIKFKSNSYGLEVIRCSTFSQGYLNRQVILLMNCLGVPDEVFMNHLNAAIENLNVDKVIQNLYQRSNIFMRSKAAKDARSQAKDLKDELDVFFGPSKIFCPIFKYCLANTLKAIEWLKQRQTEEEKINNQGEFQVSPNQAFFLEKEPIFDSILSNMVVGLAANLKKKARIRIKRSAALIGVIDEKGLLKEGEVYIKINRGSYDNDQIQEGVQNQLEEIRNSKGQRAAVGEAHTYEDETISGHVIVTKNPCSHPGDIRKLTAIGDEHEYSHHFDHLVNVVVFSSQGVRPEQHKMSGGDLDGDVYLCIWEETIVEALPKVEKPAVYKKFEESIKQKEDGTIVDYMAEYFEKDNLGHLSHMHLGLCDMIGKDGPYNKDCQELSWYISIAVDFAKHGKHVDKDKYELIERKLTKWPDYMEKKDQSKETYESPHILGKLYRAVDCKSYVKRGMQIDHKRSIKLEYQLSPIIIRPWNYHRSYCRSFHNYLIIAHSKIVAPFNEKLRDLMIHYNIGNEAELFCTNLNYTFSDENLMELKGGDAGQQKDEDAVQALNNKIKEQINIYREVFEHLTYEYKCSKFELAQAVYFTAYYNNKNLDTETYLSQFMFSADLKQSELFKDFYEYWLNYRNEQLLDIQEFEEIFNRLEDFQYYKKYMKKGLMTSQSKLKKLLIVKQFFSVPWLVCYEHLLTQGGMEDVRDN